MILSYCPHMEHKLNNTTKRVSCLTLAFVLKVVTFGTSSLLADHNFLQSKELTCYRSKITMMKYIMSHVHRRVTT